MNNKSKGTTLIEIMISILLISFIMIFLFNILINMREEYNLSSQRSQDSLNRATFTRIIQNDLIEVGLKQINISNDGNKNKFCIEFQLNDLSTKKLTVENVVENDKEVGRVIYDGEGWTLSSGTYDISNITFTYVEPKYDRFHDTGDNRFINERDTDYHLLKIIVPVSTDILSNKKYDVEVSHIGFNSVVSYNFCTKLRNYFQNKLEYRNIANSSNTTCINS